MTAIINASNTSGITFTSDTSGNLALQSNGTTVATITGSGANAGIQMGSAFAPAFSASLSAFTTISNSAWTKVLCNTEQFDTNSNYDNATNYRFTPTIAGYYQVNGLVAYDAGVTQPSYVRSGIYKNGSIYLWSSLASAGTTLLQSQVSALIYCNGSTDYIELYGYTTGGTTVGFQTGTYFSASFVRSA